MNPSVSLLMGFNCKCYLFTHEHFAGAHTIHVELEFRIVGKTEVSRKKNLSEQRREPKTNSTHIMVSIIIMVHIKSFNTLNQKTSFFSSTYLLISNNSNWIGALGTKSLWGWKGWNVHQFKGTQREALVYRGHILYFLELGTKDKLDLCF